MEKVYAFVRILNATQRYDREYTYYIRPELRAKARAGAMCTVPYGNSNKLRTGVITSLADECECNTLGLGCSGNANIRRSSRSPTYSNTPCR